MSANALMPKIKTEGSSASPPPAKKDAPTAPKQPEPSEKSQLSENMEQLYDAYGSASHATFVTPPGGHGDYLVDYEPLKFSSMRVFCISRGTILKDPVLFTEQVILTTIFFLCASPVYWYFKNKVENTTGISSGNHDEVSLSRWIHEQETKMRAFAAIMTTLAAFLLSFYTSIAVTRWWVMRTGGVGGIKAATVDLELLLYQNVTQDEKVLSAVHRYGRASLMLIFMWRRQQLYNKDADGKDTTDWALITEELKSKNLLDDAEIEQLTKWNHCLHETIWAWQSAIVTMLYKEGKISSDQLFQMLLQKCTEGRSAVQLVHTHLAVRVPMQYVHLLGLLVKMHNLVLAVIMGLLFGAAVKNGEIIICCQLFGRTLILPFLFNAILLINAELSDPFDGSETDFPGVVYQGALMKDAEGMINATKNMPPWMKERYKKLPAEP